MVRSIDQPRRRRRRRHRLADDAGLPDPQPLRDRGRQGRRRRSPASRASTSPSTCSRDQEKAGLQRKLGRGGGCPRARSPRSRTSSASARARAASASRRSPPTSPPRSPPTARRSASSTPTSGATRSRACSASAGRPPVSPERKIVPLEAGGVKVMSIGFFVEEDAAVVWRGPMLHKALTQFLEDVDWGELDFLLVDLPAGHRRRLDDARPAAARRRSSCSSRRRRRPPRRSRAAPPRWPTRSTSRSPASSRTCPASSRPSGERFQIFGEGGGQELADELDVPLLGKVPLTMPLREQADAGEPLVFTDPDDPAAQAVRQVARGLIAMFPAELPMLQVVPAGAGPEPEPPRPGGHQPADGRLSGGRPPPPPGPPRRALRGARGGRAGASCGASAPAGPRRTPRRRRAPRARAPRRRAARGRCR